MRGKFTWKIANNFNSSNGNDEECLTHSKSDNIETIVNDRADYFIEQLFKSPQNRYQNSLEESIKSSEFVFNHVHLLYFKFH